MKQQSDRVKETDKNDAFSLHVACLWLFKRRHYGTINSYPEALIHRNFDGYYPLHILIESYPDYNGFLDIIVFMLFRYW
jgi:hypothetical protein